MSGKEYLLQRFPDAIAKHEIYWAIWSESKGYLGDNGYDTEEEAWEESGRYVREHIEAEEYVKKLYPNAKIVPTGCLGMGCNNLVLDENIKIGCTVKEAWIKGRTWIEKNITNKIPPPMPNNPAPPSSEEQPERVFRMKQALKNGAYKTVEVPESELTQEMINAFVAQHIQLLNQLPRQAQDIVVSTMLEYREEELKEAMKNKPKIIATPSIIQGVS